MSDDQKKPGQAGGLPGPLPGLGGKPAGGAPLPGLGGKPAGGAPLPGLGGKPAGGAPLPGLGGGAAPVVPPFQGQQPAEPAGPSEEELARDPFGQSNLPPRRPSFVSQAPEFASAGMGAGDFTAAEAGKSKMPLLVGGALVGLLALMMGFMSGKAVNGRVALNLAICDAWIVEYEIKKAKDILEGLQSVLAAATREARTRQFDEKHIEYMKKQIKGNPIPPGTFTDRNYKAFDPAAVQWLVGYNNKWSELYDLVQDHRQKTTYDTDSLKAAGEEAKRLMTTQYGVVFQRDEDKGNKYTANIVVVGACQPDKDGQMGCKVQVDTGTYGDDRTVFTPPVPTEDEPLTDKEKDGMLNFFAEPDAYLVELGLESKQGLLKNATQSHFEAYMERLKEMNDLIKKMTEEQKNLLQKLAEISSQEPVGFLGGFDPEEKFQQYVAKDKSPVSDMAAPAEAPAEAPAQ